MSSESSETLRQPSEESQQTQDSRQSVRSDENVDKECRICYKTVTDSDLRSGEVINPCNCQGMFAFTHTKCINQRLEQNGHSICDICRYKFQMESYPKNFFNWMCTLPNAQVFIELLIRSLNLSTICIISWIVVKYSHYSVRWIWTIVLAVFALFRTGVLIYLWYQLMARCLQDFSVWKTNHLRVSVKQNPNYKPKTELQRQKSSSLMSGAFNRSKHSTKKDQ